eukprot:6597260-Pyramimonas_sp.AAC.1
MKIVEQACELPIEFQSQRRPAAAARSAPEAEAAVNQGARKALRVEWGRLRSIGAWGESSAMEYSD